MHSIKYYIDELFDSDQEQVECPECGEKFDTRKSLKLHAGQAHDDVKYVKVGEDRRKVYFIKAEDEREIKDLPKQIEEIGDTKKVEVKP